MRQVGVHLGDDLRADVERQLEPGDVGLAEAHLAGVVDYPEAKFVRGGQPLGKLTGAIGGAVVDDYEADAVDLQRRQPFDELREVLGLVEGRDDDGHPHRAVVPSDGWLPGRS